MPDKLEKFINLGVAGIVCLASLYFSFKIITNDLNHLTTAIEQQTEAIHELTKEMQVHNQILIERLDIMIKLLSN